MLHSLGTFSDVLGITVRQVRYWSDQNVLPRAFDPEKFADWALAAQMRKRGVGLPLIQKLLQMRRRSDAPFWIVNQTAKTVRPLRTKREVLRAFAASREKLLLIDVRDILAALPEELLR